jgi:hypothetical protein
LANPGNTIDLNPNSDHATGCFASGIVFWNQSSAPTTLMRNIEIGNNIIRSVGNAAKKISAVQLVGTVNNVKNVVVHDNILDPLCYFQFVSCVAVNAYNNFDLNGTSVHA